MICAICSEAGDKHKPSSSWREGLHQPRPRGTDLLITVTANTAHLPSDRCLPGNVLDAEGDGGRSLCGIRQWPPLPLASGSTVPEARFPGGGRDGPPRRAADSHREREGRCVKASSCVQGSGIKTSITGCFLHAVSCAESFTRVSS